MPCMYGFYDSFLCWLVDYASIAGGYSYSDQKLAEFLKEGGVYGNEAPVQQSENYYKYFRNILYSTR